MKKILILALTLSLILGLCACDGQSGGAKKPDNFMVGYGNTVITPTMAHGALTLGGHSTQKETYEKVVDDLPCTCIALSDADGNTALIYSLETLKCYPVLMNNIPAISEATGVPVQNIMVSTTHNHHAPNIHESVTGIDAYVEYVGKQMVEAAKLAVADLKPAKAYATAANLDGYNYCRHYIMNDGSYCTSTEWPTKRDQGLIPVGHVVEADNQLQLIKFVREGGKAVVILNWQAHPSTTPTELNIISASDQMRKIFEEKDQLLIHFNGASGDVQQDSRIEAENKFANWRERYISLAEEALKLDSTYQELPLGKLSVQAQMAGDTSILIYGVSFGDAAILFAPCEMFNDTGKGIKAGSPFKTTIIATNAMGNYGYIATAAAYEYGGYEVNTRYNGIRNGTAEEIRDGFIELMATLNANK